MHVLPTIGDRRRLRSARWVLFCAAPFSTDAKHLTRKHALRMIFSTAVLCLPPLAASDAGDARIRLNGPVEIQPGRSYELFVEADNTALNPDRTRSIEWKVTGPGWIQWISMSVPASPDFFSGPEWNPFPTYNYFFMPPTQAARSTVNPANAILDKPMSRVVLYAFRINPGFVGALPTTGTFNLPDPNVAFYSQNLVKQTHINETPLLTFTVGVARADFDRDMRVSAAEMNIFQACAAGPNIPYDVNSPASGCTCGTIRVDGQDYLKADFDNDGDVDQADFGIMQRCYSGTNLADPACGN
ncbi:MAG TPA: hypothetical protein VLM89_10000 [Phycisphaerae bacterium]|nr:hypothetical protein [Phycisphaerae bacterium]